jgi:hypothetical protein
MPNPHTAQLDSTDGGLLGYLLQLLDRLLLMQRHRFGDTFMVPSCAFRLQLRLDLLEMLLHRV